MLRYIVLVGVLSVTAAACNSSDEAARVENPPAAAGTTPATEPAGQGADATAPGDAGSQAADTQAPVSSSPQGELPRTASPLALAGLIGLLSLGAAAGVRALRR
jgi:hypothetical protein